MYSPGLQKNLEGYIDSCDFSVLQLALKYPIMLQVSKVLLFVANTKIRCGMLVNRWNSESKFQEL